MCTGGVDASLAKASSSALLHALQSAEQAAGTAGQEMKQHIASLLITVWQKEGGRLSLPLIRTTQLLLTKADFAEVPLQPVQDIDISSASGTSSMGNSSSTCSKTAIDAPSNGTMSHSSTAETKSMAKAEPTKQAAPQHRLFASAALDCLKKELRQCRDVCKLLDGAALVAQLCGVHECRDSALQSVMVLLVNRYPKVNAGIHVLRIGWWQSSYCAFLVLKSMCSHRQPLSCMVHCQASSKLSRRAQCADELIVLLLRSPTAPVGEFAASCCRYGGIWLSSCMCKCLPAKQLWRTQWRTNMDI